jgi:ATPase subunit of ABC transporter with duplicated ATPase domains
LIRLDEVVAGYRDPVVGPVSLSVSPGEVVGLTGPNASGKSTVLNAIVGTARVFEGVVTRQAGLRVTVQQQRPVRLAEMPLTGQELLRLTGAHGAEAPPAVAALHRQRLDRLSGGQYQLLYVWACLAGHAELVLLDEPTNNMDPQAVATVRQALGAPFMRERGVLVISHVRDLLNGVCTRIVHVGA